MGRTKKNQFLLYFCLIFLSLFSCCFYLSCELTWTKTQHIHRGEWRGRKKIYRINTCKRIRWDDNISFLFGKKNECCLVAAVVVSAERPPKRKKERNLWKHHRTHIYWLNMRTCEWKRVESYLKVAIININFDTSGCTSLYALKSGRLS